MMAVDFLLPVVLLGTEVKHVAVWCDNTNACSWVNKLYAADGGLPMHARRMAWLVGFWRRQGVANRHIWASYINTKLNLRADQLSRRGPLRDGVLAELLSTYPSAVRVPIPQSWQPGFAPSA